MFPFLSFLATLHVHQGLILDPQNYPLIHPRWSYYDSEKSLGKINCINDFIVFTIDNYTCDVLQKHIPSALRSTQCNLNIWGCLYKMMIHWWFKISNSDKLRVTGLKTQEIETWTPCIFTYDKIQVFRIFPKKELPFVPTQSS